MVSFSFKCFQRFLTSFSVQHLVFVFCLQNVNFIWSSLSVVIEMLKLSIWFGIFGLHQMHRLLVNRCLGFLLLKQTFSFWIFGRKRIASISIHTQNFVCIVDWERLSEALQKNSTYIMQCTGLTDFPIRCEHCFQCHRSRKRQQQRHQHTIRHQPNERTNERHTQSQRQRECCERSSNKRQQ